MNNVALEDSPIDLSVNKDMAFDMVSTEVARILEDLPSERLFPLNSCMRIVDTIESVTYGEYLRDEISRNIEAVVIADVFIYGQQFDCPETTHNRAIMALAAAVFKYRYRLGLMDFSPSIIEMTRMVETDFTILEQVKANGLEITKEKIRKFALYKGKKSTKVL